VEVRRPAELVLEVPEFGQEALQSLRFLFELPGVLGPLSLVLGVLNGCDRAGAKDYAAFLGFFSLELP